MLCWTPEHPLCDFRKLLAVSQRDSLQGETALTEVATRIELRTYKSLSGQYPSLLASKLWSFCPRTPVASTRAFVSFTAYQPQLLSEGHSTFPVPFPAGLNLRAGLLQPRSLRLMAPSPRYSSGYQQANCQHPFPRCHYGSSAQFPATSVFPLSGAPSQMQPRTCLCSVSSCQIWPVILACWGPSSNTSAVPSSLSSANLIHMLSAALAKPLIKND